MRLLPGLKDPTIDFFESNSPTTFHADIFTRVCPKTKEISSPKTQYSLNLWLLPIFSSFFQLSRSIIRIYFAKKYIKNISYTHIIWFYVFLVYIFFCLQSNNFYDTRECLKYTTRNKTFSIRKIRVNLLYTYFLSVVYVTDLNLNMVIMMLL